MDFANPQSLGGAPALVRPDRFPKMARASRLSPGIYATVFERKPDEHPLGAQGMPPYCRLASARGAYVPTLSDWADPPRVVALAANSAVARIAPTPAAATHDDFRLRLMEAQLRSEQRLRQAALALMADELAKPSASATSAHASGALTARF